MLVSLLQSDVVWCIAKNPSTGFGWFMFPTDLQELFPDPCWERAVLRQDRLLPAQLLPHAPPCHIPHLLGRTGRLPVPQPPLHDGFTVSNGAGITRHSGKRDVMGSTGTLKRVTGPRHLAKHSSHLPVVSPPQGGEPGRKVICHRSPVFTNEAAG